MVHFMDTDVDIDVDADTTLTSSRQQQTVPYQIQKQVFKSEDSVKPYTPANDKALFLKKLRLPLLQRAVAELPRGNRVLAHPEN